VTLPWASESPGERRRSLESHVRGALARILRWRPARIGSSTPFKSLGVDSIMAVELRNHLESTLGLQLTVGLIWAHPCVAELADFLAERLGGADASTSRRLEAADNVIQALHALKARSREASE
jgi:acyl carrier protein